MILASHGIIASQIASFDADAAAFFARVTAAGGTLSATEKIATNQLVLDLKANSLWTPMKAIYPMVGASAAACAQNLKSSSFTGTFTSTGWTFASTGITGNGTSAYFDTTVTNNIDITDRASHWSTYFRTLGNAGFCGYFNAANAFGVQPRAASNVIATGLNNIAATSVNSVIGYLVGSVNSATDAKLYVNNSLVFTLSNPTAISQNLDFYLGALNSSGSAILYATQEIAFSSLGGNLNNTQASNFYTAVQAFQTTLSRQV